MPSTGRIYFLDSARAILMLLGIPYHVALVYAPGNNWRFAKSQRTSQLLAYFADMVHTFRMPAFFLLAGYFAMVMLERKGPGEWLRGRTVKLGVPLVAGGLLLNPISLLAQAPTHIGTLGDHWLAHLWFLPALMVMFAILALMRVTPLLRWFEGLIDWVVRTPEIGVVVLLLLASGLSGLGSILSTRISDIFLVRVTMSPVVGYLPFLLLGAAMRINRQVQEFMSTCSLAGFVLAMLPLWFLLNTTWGGPLTNITRILALTMVSICLGRALIALCRQLLDRPSTKMRKLANASFTIYLVHFPIFNFFYILFAPAALPVLLEYLLLVAMVTIASYGMHVLMARSEILMFMFNGVSFPKRQPAIVQVETASK